MQREDLSVFNRKYGVLLNPGMIILIVIIAILAYIKQGYGFEFVFLVLFGIVFFCVPAVAKESLTSIIVNKQDRTITFIMSKWGRASRKRVLPLKEVKITFRKEAMGNAMKDRVFQVFQQQDMIIQISPATSGWDTKILEEVQSLTDQLNNDKINTDQDAHI